MSSFTNDLLIDAVDMLEIDDSQHIPSVVYYSTEINPLIGHSAIVAARQKRGLNVNFKVELGAHSQDSPDAIQYPTNVPSLYRTAYQLSYDYLGQLAYEISRETQNRQAYVLVSEPISIQSESMRSESWLPNYRKNIRSIFSDFDISPEVISFLPEPFAVFQYYKYVKRFPAIAQRHKSRILVIDFGGGTFDTSVIETTSEGEISASGRNSRPLAANSIQVGGFFVNQCIAERAFELAGKEDKPLRTAFNKGIKTYRKWKKGTIRTISGLDHESFCHEFDDLVYRIDSRKIALANNIQNWALDADVAGAINIGIRSAPFTEKEQKRNVKLTVKNIRELFVDRVWKPHLKKALAETIERYHAQEPGESIDVVLLSGGSANLQWLQRLVEEEVCPQIGFPSILALKDYREVVAKGLAAECARRNHDADAQGDFSSVTYNQLNLVLRPDDSAIETPLYKAQITSLPDTLDQPGLLLPSASVLKDLFDTPLEWKAKLRHPPRKHLEYHFLKSSVDPDDIESRYNVEQTFVETPRGVSFGSSIRVGLLVNSNGSACPSFVYGKGRSITTIKGRPFGVDVTDRSHTHDPHSSYVGVDFGTSNSAISLLSGKTISTYRMHGSGPVRENLAGIADVLPSPLATTLRKVLSKHDRFLDAANPDSVIKASLIFLESALSLLAYGALLESLAILGPAKVSAFRGFTKRSVGPLWGLLKNLVNLPVHDRPFFDEISVFRNGAAHTTMETAVNALRDYKHEKRTSGEIRVDVMKAVELAAKTSHRIFATRRFGFFSEVRSKPFSSPTMFTGRFQVAVGSSQNFTESLNYEGPFPLSEYTPAVADADKGKVLPLHPLILWHSCPKHRDLEDGHCFVFDSSDEYVKGRPSYVATDTSCLLELSDEELKFLENHLRTLRDPERQGPEILSDLRLSQRG